LAKKVDFEFIDVLKETEQLDVMMKYSGGQRRVPVIVDGEKVSIGFNGRT
jgi:glutaredoxin